MTGEVADRVPLKPTARTEPVDGRAEAELRVATLFDTHHRRLYALARRMSGSADEARDLVQETFLRVTASPQRVPVGASREEAWLVRVLINLCRDRWRRSAVRQRHTDDLPTASGPADPERTVMARSVIWRALEQLSPRRRAIVVMHELEGLSPVDIARVLGVATVTVRWHLSRGRRELALIIRG